MNKLTVNICGFIKHLKNGDTPEVRNINIDLPLNNHYVVRQIKLVLRKINFFNSNL